MAKKSKKDIHIELENNFTKKTSRMDHWEECVQSHPKRCCFVDEAKRNGQRKKSHSIAPNKNPRVRHFRFFDQLSHRSFGHLLEN
jgi:hypothetical protein